MPRLRRVELNKLKKIIVIKNNKIIIIMEIRCSNNFKLHFVSVFNRVPLRVRPRGSL